MNGMYKPWHKSWSNFFVSITALGLVFLIFSKCFYFNQYKRSFYHHRINNKNDHFQNKESHSHAKTFPKIIPQIIRKTEFQQNEQRLSNLALFSQMSSRLEQTMFLSNDNWTTAVNISDCLVMVLFFGVQWIHLGPMNSHGPNESKGIPLDSLGPWEFAGSKWIHWIQGIHWSHMIPEQTKKKRTLKLDPTES